MRNSKSVLKILFILGVAFPALLMANGYKILNGGDGIIEYVESFKRDSVQILSALKGNCKNNLPVAPGKLIQKIKDFKFIIVDETLEEKSFYYIDEKNYVKNEIRINGKRRPFANAPEINTIFIDRSLWQRQFSHSRLLIHEVLGLLGEEKTDEYSKTGKILTMLALEGCSEKRAEDKLNVSRGCAAIDLLGSQIENPISEYDDSTHLFGVYDSNSGCLLFWDAENNRRKSSLDLKISKAFENFYLHKGNLYIQTAKTLERYTYTKESNFEEHQVLTFGSKVEFISDYGDYIIIQNEGAFRIYTVDLKPVYLNSEIKGSIKQAIRLPIDPLKKFPAPDQYSAGLLVGSSGEVFYLYSGEESGFQVQKLFNLSAENIAFPFTVMGNSYLLGANGNSTHLSGEETGRFSDEKILLQTSLYDHFVSVKKLTSPGAKLLNMVGDLAYQYSEVYLSNFDLKLQHIEHTAIGAFSSDILQVVFDSELQTYFLLGKNWSKKGNNLFVLRLESGRDLESCLWLSDSCLAAKE